MRLMNLVFLLLASTAAAHEFTITQVTCLFRADGAYQIDMRVDVDALALGVSPQTPNGELMAQLASLSESEFNECVERARETIRRRTRLRFDGELVTYNVTFPDRDELTPADLEVAETVLGTTARLTGRAPAGAREFTFGASRSFPVVQLTIIDLGRRGYSQQMLPLGADSTPYQLGPFTPRAEAESADALDELPPPTTVTPDVPAEAPPIVAPLENLREGNETWNVAREYLVIGFEHILPLGIDHVLFVLGLFLLSRKWWPLIWQISAFTVAHTLTLALSMAGIIALPERVVEPLIAASIAYVAIENIFTQKLTPWRPVLVFMFGLLHGLGFAGILHEQQPPEGQFLTALVSFNVGVELGQLAVVAIAFALVGWCRGKSWYRPGIAIPASVLIALVGLWWAFERAVFGV